MVDLLLALALIDRGVALLEEWMRNTGAVSEQEMLESQKRRARMRAEIEEMRERLNMDEEG